VFATKYQLKRVTVAIFNCASFHGLCCLVNRKGKSLNKQRFYQNNKMFRGSRSYITCSNAVFRHWHSPIIVLSLVVLPCRWYIVRSRPTDQLFSGIKSLLLLWKPYSRF